MMVSNLIFLISFSQTRVDIKNTFYTSNFGLLIMIYLFSIFYESKKEPHNHSPSN